MTQTITIAHVGLGGAVTFAKPSAWSLCAAPPSLNAGRCRRIFYGKLPIKGDPSTAIMALAGMVSEARAANDDMKEGRPAAAMLHGVASALFAKAASLPRTACTAPTSRPSPDGKPPAPMLCRRALSLCGGSS